MPDIQRAKADFLFGVSMHVPGNDIRRLATCAENLAADFLVVTAADEKVALLQPAMVLAYLAPRTTIGLVAEFDVTYAEPFFASRALATLDHVATGRVAWQLKVDASDESARKRALPAPLAGELTDRVVEFTNVVRDLWDSWEDDAIVRDKARGIFIRADRVHHLNHTGRYFAVRGPATLPRPPQGHPPTFVTLTDDAQSRRLAQAVGEILRLRTTSVDKVRAARKEFPEARIVVDIPFISLSDTLTVLDTISDVAHGIIVDIDSENVGEATIPTIGNELANRGLRDLAPRSGTLRQRLGLSPAVNRFAVERVS
jgi:alkanesulfonate monooxygenase SsuD/methylene tetrahydromethanopterin reductase-like flavin-dependent oxidoreductase (luciferase family)